MTEKCCGNARLNTLPQKNPTDPIPIAVNLPPPMVNAWWQFTARLVLSAMIAGVYGYPAVDGWAGLGVALFLIYTGFGIAKNAVDDLIGKPPTTEEVENIRQIVLSIDGVLGAHDITVHSYGQDKFASVHVEIDAEEITAVAHDISEEVGIFCVATLETQFHKISIFDVVSSKRIFGK